MARRLATRTRRRWSRRAFIRFSTASAGTLLVVSRFGGIERVKAMPVPGGTLDPRTVAKYRTPMLIPPVMPRAGTLVDTMGKNIDYYEISMKQFEQQILPAGYPATAVWGYGAVSAAGKRGVLLHNAPSLTIEARHGRPVRVKWINALLDDNGKFLPHLLPVDPTLHWANPPGGVAFRDTRPTYGSTPLRYSGPVPIVTHVHGAVGVGDESDGYAEAWYLPAATNIPAGHATSGTWYDFFKNKAAAAFGAIWEPGCAVFQYPNLGRASTDWYHDHALGMTRLNVYAGPAGFYIIRGGPSGDSAVRDARTGGAAALPGPAPSENDRFPSNKRYREIAIAIQDRAFNSDGSLFYPASREFFDGIVAPYIPASEFAPIWNPEFFGNMIMVNGNTWPFQTVEQRRYRFRALNGCQSRFLILDFNAIPGVRVWQIANEGGFLAAPVDLSRDNDNRLLMGPAERADILVDFTAVPIGRYVLRNLGPDEPYGGGSPSVDFEPADAETTGQVLEFRVVPPVDADDTTPPEHLLLPAITALPGAVVTRRLALIEKSAYGRDADGEEVEGPVEALLGTVDEVDDVPREALWMDPVTENPEVGTTEVWEIYNTTADAHPMHVHEIAFQVVNREGLVLDEEEEVLRPIQLDGVVTGPEPWETGFKDTVIAYPGEVTRIRARFDTPGQFVWHCHIVEHEDNEMMRPYRIGPEQPGQPGAGSG